MRYAPDFLVSLMHPRSGVAHQSYAANRGQLDKWGAHARSGSGLHRIGIRRYSGRLRRDDTWHANRAVVRSGGDNQIAVKHQHVFYHHY